MRSRPVVSVVVPARNEEATLPELHRRLCKALDGVEATLELVVVDDASTDGTWGQITALAQLDSRVRGVRLRENLGELVAVWVGVAVCSGDAVVVMDADLQHPPEYIPEMLDKWKDGAQVVAMCRQGKPAAGWLRAFGAELYYRVGELVCEHPIPRGHGGFALYDRSVVDQVVDCPTTPPFVRAAAIALGASTETLPYIESPRPSGNSRNDVAALARIATCSFVATSPRRSKVATSISYVLAAVSSLEAARSFADFVEGRRQGSLAKACLLVGLGLSLLGVARQISRTSRPYPHSPSSLVAESVGFGFGTSPPIFPRSIVRG